MKAKLLELLKTKFGGVDSSILDRIATKKAIGITDETLLDSVVEGINFQDVLQSYGDFRAGAATQTAVANYEKRFNLKDGKPIHAPEPEPKPTPEPVPTPEPAPKPEPKQKAKPEEAKPKTDETPKWAKDLQAAMTKLSNDNETLRQQVETMKDEKEQADFTARVLKAASDNGISQEYMKFLKPSKDEDLDAYMKDFAQLQANNNFAGVKEPESADEKIEKETESIANAINEDTKKIVENKN